MIRRKQVKLAGCLLCGMLAAGFLMPCMVQAQEPDAMRISFNKTPSQYKAYAAALGQRLRQSGRERITATGQLAYAEAPDKPFRVGIVWQYPLKLMLTDSESSQTFDLASASVKAPADRLLAGTVEALLEDSAEGLLSLLPSAAMTRHLGSGYTLPDARGKGRGIDIVQATFATALRGGQPVAKTYWFDSTTGLLGLVEYESASGDAVDVVVDDWREVDGEKIPFLIERWENGKLVMRLTLLSAAVTAGIADGTFGGN